MTDAARSVVVLGAGLAGLRASQHLLERGHRVELLERLGEVGGMARSHEIDGFVFDHGPHGFFSREQWIVDEFQRLIETEGGFHWLTKWSQIHYRNTYFNFPLKLADLVSKMSPLTVLAAGFSFLAARARVRITKREAANAEQYLIDQFGRVLYDVFFGPYTRKVWDVEPSELDADFTRDRVPSLNLWDVIRKLFTDPAKEQFRVGPSGRVVTHDLHKFYYPKKGAGALPRAYARRVAELGGEFRFDVEVESIDTARQVVTGRVAGEPFTLPYDGLVSTIPLDALMRLLRPSPPAEIAALATSLRHRGILLVNLCVAKPKVIDSFWVYFTDRFFNRISEYKHFSPDLVPEGKTGICCEVGCNESAQLWNTDDAEIVRRCVDDLEGLGLVQRGEVENFQVIREPNAYPIYDIGYKDRVSRLVEWLETTLGIVTAGRQGRFLYINQDAAIQSGFDAGTTAARRLETGETVFVPVGSDERPRRKIVV
jgi:protoporphyrinogen oxidase